MKNIHLLPTDKPSRLVIDTIENKLYYQPILHNKTVNVLTQHIYITSDEEIKVNDYITDGYLVWQWKDDSSLLGRKKVILTTDQDLIADGVQAIDDIFLEWFVKNPSCESVEVENDYLLWKNSDKEKLSDCYKIIIPKEESKYSEDEFEMQSRIINKVWDEEESKQETLEEVVRIHLDKNKYSSPITYAKLGAKWQAERGYSDDEVKRIAFDFYYDMSHKMNVPENLISENATNVDGWFKQFKKG
jgi:hypothetical protein